MSFLEFFHFDKDPFPLNSSYNYVFKNKAQFNIIDEVVNNLRFYHGIYSIVGHSGIGKTFMLNQILMQVKNNDFTFFICANEKTNLFKMFAEQFSLKKYEENDIIQFISKHYKNGENIFFFIYDF